MADTFRTHIQNHGRVVIPAAFRRDMRLNIGDEVFLRHESDCITIIPVDAALEHFRTAVARHFPGDRSLAAELIAERRAEAAAEHD